MNLSRKVPAGILAMGLAGLYAFGTASSAHAEETAPTTETTKVVTWRVLDLNNRWAVPQTLAANTLGCGTGGFQIDTYRYGTPEDIAFVDALIAKGTLSEGEDSAVYVSNIDMTTKPCEPTPEPTPPPVTTTPEPTAPPVTPAPTPKPTVKPEPTPVATVTPTPTRAPQPRVATVPTATAVAAPVTADDELAFTGTKHTIRNIAVALGLLIVGFFAVRAGRKANRIIDNAPTEKD